MSGISTRYYGVTADSVSSLFASASTSGSSSSGTGSIISDYYSIRNGSYKKLLQKYYALDNESGSKTSSTSKNDSTVSASSSTSKDSTKTLKMVKEAATALDDSAEKLLERGTKSLFHKDSNGEYDTDKIASAVKDFVKDYNDAISTGESANSSSIQKTTSQLQDMTKTYKKNLEQVGITIGSDGKLSVDTDTLKKSSMSAVADLFNEKGGFAYQAEVKAKQLEYNVNAEASKNNTYNGSGSYSYNYSAGDLYDSLF